jgi:hypothetical protein
MIRKLMFVAAISLTAVPQASAWNDIAGAQCARWNKFPVATSIHRVPGDYIAYKCVWDPPEVAVVRHHRRIDVKIDK